MNTVLHSTLAPAGRIAGLVAAAAATLATAAAEPLPEAVRAAFREWRTPDYDYEPPEPGTYALPDFGPASDGVVVGVDGRPVRLHDLADGRIVVLSFIYTRCPDPKACVLATGILGELRRLSRLVPGMAERLLLVSLSFDPAHDTPDVMARYGRIASEGIEGAEWLFLTTRSPEELAPLLEAYGQRIDPREDPDGVAVFSHPMRVYLVDGRRKLRNIYSHGLFDPRLVIGDIATLMAEEQPAGETE